MDKNSVPVPLKRRWWIKLLAIVKHVGWLAVGGLVVAIALLVILAELTEDVFRNEFSNFDQTVELNVHSWATPWLDGFFTFCSFVGGIVGIIVITTLTFGLLIWRKYYIEAISLLLAVGGGTIINLTLKQLFQRPRPEFWTSNFERPTSFSFPSNHATLAVCLFGYLLWLGLKFIRRPFWKVAWSILMLFLIGLIGLSRIYLGVHYPTDVIAGYLSASIWLLILVSGHTIYAHLRSRLRKLTNSQT